MNNFGRVLKIAARRRFALVGILITSLIIALLWGANIGTLYPLVEVVFKGDSLPSYVESRVKASQLELAEVDKEMQEVTQAAQSASGEQKTALAVELQTLESRRKIVSEASQWYTRVKPWVDTYAPEGAYATLLLIVAMLVGGTALKLLALMFNLLLVQYVAERTAFDLRSDFFRKSLALDLDSFGENGSAELTSRLTNDVSHVSAGVAVLLGRMVREPLKMMVCLGGAMFICWRLMLLVMIVTPLVAVVITYLSLSLIHISEPTRPY